MRALSIQAPWSYCITHGTKRVENRTWSTNFRGVYLIHAGKTYQTGIEHAIHADSPEMDVVEMRHAPRGGFVGVARLIDCVDVAVNADGSRADRAQDFICDRIAPDQRIWTGGPFAFVLDDVWALPEVVPYRGELGFFNVAGAAVEIIKAHLRERAAVRA